MRGHSWTAKPGGPSSSVRYLDPEVGVAVCCPTFAPFGAAAGGTCQSELEVFLLWRYQTAPAPPAPRTPIPTAATAAAAPAAAMRAPPTMTFGRCRRACRRAYTVAAAVETISNASSICRSTHFDPKMLDLRMGEAYSRWDEGPAGYERDRRIFRDFLRIRHAAPGWVHCRSTPLRLRSDGQRSPPRRRMAACTTLDDTPRWAL
jgi:hypothetical protein